MLNPYLFIYIHGKTEVIDDISVFFVYYFYKNLLEDKTIEQSFKEAMKEMNSKEDIRLINKKSCCCYHYHEPDCILESKLKRESFHSDIHSLKSEKCQCKHEQRNHHDKGCEYYDILKKGLSKCKPKKIKEEKDKNIICCCGNDIEHNELLKIIYEAKYDTYKTISPFSLNRSGKLFIESNISLYFEKDKYAFTLGRRNIMGKIFHDITNNGNYAFLLGSKELLKTYFAESLSVYLYERKVINSYEIFRINCDFDFYYMFDKLNKFIKDENIERTKKNIKIIKFDIVNKDKKCYDYLNEIYKKFISLDNNGLYFIFILDIENQSKEQLEQIIPKEINENVFYPKLDEHFSIKLLNYFIEGKSIKIRKIEKRDLVKDIAKYNPKYIKLISELLLQGETVENIKKMQELKLTDIDIIKEESSFSLYYLLLNMPSGLPDIFLKLIFKNYDSITDEKNIIIKSPINNWNLINKNKKFKDNFKESKFMETCYIHLLDTLILYAKLLNFFINEKKEKVKYGNGNIHYVFNSYSDRNIWKSSFPNIIGKIIGKKIFDKDFDIENHKENILSLINLVVNDIKLFRKLKQWKDYYLEEILLLFPSFFFLSKDNKKYLQICIDLCTKLIFNSGEDLKQRIICLKQKLLLYLYSIDESKKDILLYKSKLDHEFEIEVNFLKELRKIQKKTDDLEKLIKPNISTEMKLYLLREIAIIHFNSGNYELCLDKLNQSLNIININNIFKNRIIIDSSYVFKKLYKSKNEEESIENYELIKEKIETLNNVIEKPFQKDIYYEAYNIRNSIIDLLEPDIIMLNSNPLKTISNKDNILNNQYYILTELKKSINSHIRLKSLILNEDNLNYALNRKGEILIIQ